MIVAIVCVAAGCVLSIVGCYCCRRYRETKYKKIHVANIFKSVNGYQPISTNEEYF